VVPDKELREYVQRCFGYALLGGQGAKAVFIAHGKPDGGKSTMVDALLRSFGDYGTVTRLATFGAAADVSGNTPGLAMLHGPRLVVVNEVPALSKLSDGLLKQWSGGNRVEAIQKRERPFKFYPAGKLWFLGNDPPEVRYDDEGVWRRVHVLPFDNPIPKAQQIADFVDRPNLTGVLTWAVEGYHVPRGRRPEPARPGAGGGGGVPQRPRPAPRLHRGPAGPGAGRLGGGQGPARSVRLVVPVARRGAGAG
jgi:putative DNA primase/helicase